MSDMEFRANDYKGGHGKKTKKRGGRRKTAAEIADNKEADVPVEPKQIDELPRNTKKVCHLPMEGQPVNIPKETEMQPAQVETTPQFTTTADVCPFLKEENAVFDSDVNQSFNYTDETNQQDNYYDNTNVQDDWSEEIVMQPNLPDNTNRDSWNNDAVQQANPSSSSYPAKNSHQYDTRSSKQPNPYNSGRANDKFGHSNRGRNKGDFKKNDPDNRNGKWKDTAHREDNRWDNKRREHSRGRSARDESPKKYPNKRDNVSRQDYFSSKPKKRDDGYDEFMKNHIYAKKEYKIVKEIDGDLFAMGQDYALAHCVATDMNMGSGIATTFRNMFKNVGELMEQNVSQGGVAFLELDGRYIYYLVTKRISSGKPTLDTMYRSVYALKNRMLEHGVKKLAIPRLGCGLDRLEWSDVKNMLEFIFEGTDIEITVCNFQQAEGQMEVSEAKHKKRKCYVTDSLKPINEIDKYTIILYLGTENGYVDDVLEKIDKRYGVVMDYKKARKEEGKIVDKLCMGDEYLVCGCIARKTERDPISFKALESAFSAVNKLNKTFKDYAYEFVAISRYDIRGDNLFMSKVTNLLRNTFHAVDVYIC